MARGAGVGGRVGFCGRDGWALVWKGGCVERAMSSPVVAAAVKGAGNHK